jgi:hypothetical protein
MQAASRAYRLGGFILTFFTAFMAVSNYNSYTNPEEITVLRESIVTAMDDQREMYGGEGIDEVYDSLENNLDEHLTVYKYKRSSLFKLIGAFIALVGSVFLRRKKKLGAHLFLGGMLFSIIGTFYFHSFGLTGWALIMMPLLFTLVVSIFIYRKRASLT